MNDLFLQLQKFNIQIDNSKPTKNNIDECKHKFAIKDNISICVLCGEEIIRFEDTNNRLDGKYSVGYNMNIRYDKNVVYLKNIQTLLKNLNLDSAIEEKVIDYYTQVCGNTSGEKKLTYRSSKRKGIICACIKLISLENNTPKDESLLLSYFDISIHDLYFGIKMCKIAIPKFRTIVSEIKSFLSILIKKNNVNIDEQTLLKIHDSTPASLFKSKSKKMIAAVIVLYWIYVNNHSQYDIDRFCIVNDLPKTFKLFFSKFRTIYMNSVNHEEYK